MKRAIFALCLLASACCGTASTPSPIPPHKLGMGVDQPIGWATPLATIPSFGNNGTGIIYDTTAGDTVTGRQFTLQRIGLGIRCDQTVNVTCQVKRTGSSTWRTCPSQENTDGSVNTTSTLTANPGGTLVTASVDYFVDFVVQGPETRLRVTNGATAPTACEVDIGLMYQRELGQ